MEASEIGGGPGRKGGGGEGKPSLLQVFNTRRWVGESIYAYAHAADPVYSLRQSRSATKLPRRPFVDSTRRRSLGGTHGDPKGYPKGTQGDPKGPKGTQRGDGAKGTQGWPQRDPRGPQKTQGDPKGTRGPKGPKRTQGDPRGPKGAFGALGGMGPWGPLGLLRSHSEEKIVPNRKPYRMD